MLVGFVGLGIAAAFGLTWIASHHRRLYYPLLALAFVLFLVEAWPRPWPTEQLRPTPEFYKHIAGDGAQYGVFDLPTTTSPFTPYVNESAQYMLYQMTHGKGIAAGYISRTYRANTRFSRACSLSTGPSEI